MDITIKEYSDAINVRSIAAIKRQGDRVAFGTRVDAIRATLVGHAGEWVSTAGVTLECAPLLGVDLSNANMTSDFRHVILKELGQHALPDLAAPRRHWFTLWRGLTVKVRDTPIVWRPH